MAEGSGIWVPPGGSADPPRPEQPQAEPGPETITQEELLEQIRRLRVSDVVLSTLQTVAQLGYAKLDPSSRDLGQARVAIETIKALVPVLEGDVPDDVLASYRSVVSNLQLAYVEASAAEPDPA